MKELLDIFIVAFRVGIMTFGGGVSQFKNSPMQAVANPEDLDKVLVDGLPYDALAGILHNLKSAGGTISHKATYRKACIDGWAPAPTNDYQKVIWEEIHAKPTNPIKIKFDPAKGE